MISAKFVPLKYYTLSSQLRRLTSFSVGLFGSANSVTRSYPVMRKSCMSGKSAFLGHFFYIYILTFCFHILFKNAKLRIRKKADPYFPIFWVGWKRANKHFFYLGLNHLNLNPLNYDPIWVNAKKSSHVVQ